MGATLPAAASAPGRAAKPQTIGRIVRRTIEIARHEGLKVLWFQILGETIYRRLDIYARRLDGRLERLPSRIPVRIAALRESDLAAYPKLRPDIGADEARRRLREGQFCWIAWSEERMAGEIWANPRSGWIEYLECELPLREGQVYVYQNFTIEALRHRGISGALLSTAREYLRELGYRETIGVIRPDKANDRMAATSVVGRIGYWRFAGRRRYFLRWSPASAAKSSPAGEWDDVARKMAGGDSYLDPLLAELKRATYVKLLDRWAGPVSGGRCLKTDVFEEAFGSDAFLDDLARRSAGAVGMAVGMDVSAETARLAQARMGRIAPLVAADVRSLPFADGSLTLIVSPSTLDHFSDPRDLTVSLRELARVLLPGGRMIVTMDNPQNLLDPLLRAAARLGMVPYYLGRSCTIDELCRELELAGLRVMDRTAILHGPRLIPTAAMKIAGWLGGQRMKRWVRRRLESAEKLEGTRWRYRTGSFIAAVAVK